jgi:hypothetical protein
MSASALPTRGRSVPSALVINPRTDGQFVAYAESVMSEGHSTIEGFEARLRERYPSAVVRARELASEPYTLWYCYRDGKWTPPDGEPRGDW